MKHLLGIKDLKKQEIEEIIALGLEVKKRPEIYFTSLHNKSLAMIFQKTSTRTRVSFEVAMTQLGGHAQYLDWRTTNFTLGDISDEIKCISRYVDIIMARVYKHRDVAIMAKSSSVPVINGLSDLEHPCQILGDLLTIKERFGNFMGVKVAYVGDGNNVCNSLIIGCAKLGIPISVSTPLNYQPDKFALLIGRKLKKLFLTDNPYKAVKGANVVYTDTWVSMGDEAEKEKRLKAFLPYQVNKRLMKAASHPCFMHCLPVHRGCEVTSDVLDSKESIVYDQAENRLPIQKAIILTLLQEI